MARKAHVPTRKNKNLVEAMSAFGIPSLDIGRVLGITEKTLRKHYRTELDLGEVKMIAKVAGNLYRTACGKGRESVTACIFILKTRAGWSEYRPPPGRFTGKDEQQPDEKLGKKDAADRAALDAETGTSWEHLLPN